MLWLAPALRSVPTNKKTHVAAGHFRSCGVLVIVVGRPTDNIDEKNIGFLSHKSPAVKTGLTSKE
jgi:hypothetical protein